MTKINTKCIYFAFKCNLIHFNISRFCRSCPQNVFKSEKLNSFPPDNKLKHHYRRLFPWKNNEEFNENIISSIIYNEGGLIALNKPFGIQIYGPDKPGTRCKDLQRYIIPHIKECDYTIEDSLPTLQKYLNVSKLSILKSAERYSSGVVLLGSEDSIAARLTKALSTAKVHKKLHFVHWAVTLGYPPALYRKEKVGIKSFEAENGKFKQFVIQTDISKRACSLKKVHPVNVECRTLSINQAFSTSLIEIASSSVKFHFVRLYASSRMAPILGDLMYGSRMKTLLGIPVKVQLQNSCAYDLQPLPEKMSEILNLPKGVNGHSMVPTMLHLRSIILPNFKEKGKDLIITAEPPTHFQWTTEKLDLLHS